MYWISQHIYIKILRSPKLCFGWEILRAFYEVVWRYYNSAQIRKVCATTGILLRLFPDLVIPWQTMIWSGASDVLLAKTSKMKDSIGRIYRSYDCGQF